MYAISRLFLPAILVAVFAQDASSQTPQLREGIKVQLETRSTNDVVGIVKSLNEDSVVLFSGNSGATLSLARADITGIRVSHGRSAARGAIRGAMWGTAAGAVATAIVVVSFKADQNYSGPDDDLTYIVVNSLVGGALWGAAIGGFVKSEKWETIQIRPRLSRSSSSARLSFSFQPSLLH